TGEIGSGKTTLSRMLLQQLDGSTKTAIVRNTHVSAKDLIAETLDELEVAFHPRSTKRRLVSLLNSFVVEQLREGNNVVLLIDEAQNLTPTVLEEVRMLSNLETETDKLIQIILMGQPELKAKLWLKDLTQLRQRVTLHYHLAPLDEGEAEAYISHRLHVAGGNGQPLFASDALARIFYHTRGVPRLINGLCDQALLTGYVNDEKTIGGGIIDEAAGELPALVETPA
ncbi:MAG TPA: AAA family ATPase, partial [archaeon]|nr:AAA family ATPase [archaeon]